ncbi:MAG: hypothetical protein HOV81_03660 [Kofleriaceae bacterium]|nr:hypothetical protein [Kofleriaceae bacterium]
MAGIDAWMAWSNQAAGSFVDLGSPVGDAVRVSKGGATAASASDLAGYSIMQAESKEALAATMKEHPHFMMPDGWIEIVEITPIPGM